MLDRAPDDSLSDPVHNYANLALKTTEPSDSNISVPVNTIDPEVCPARGTNADLEEEAVSDLKDEFKLTREKHHEIRAAEHKQLKQFAADVYSLTTQSMMGTSICFISGDAELKTRCENRGHTVES